MKFSPDMLLIFGSSSVDHVSRDEVPAGLKAIVDEGWFIDDGAVLLRGFHRSYHGDRSRFRDVTGYEVAVNGRGIPDMDIEDTGDERIRRLIRRGLAFARSALYEANRSIPEATVVGYVSASPTLIDPEYYTGNVTFHSLHDDESPYNNVSLPSAGMAIVVDSMDCVHPLLR